MSSSTFTFTVQPGEQLAARIAAARADADAERKDARNHRRVTRERQLIAGGRARPGALTQARAEADARREEASAEQRASLSRAVREAERTGNVKQVEQAIAKVDRELQRRSDVRVSQRLTMEEIERSYPGAPKQVKGTIVENADGSMQLNTALGGGGTLPLVARGDSAGGYRFDVEVAGAGLDRVMTENGLLVDCEATEWFAAETHRNLQANGNRVGVEPQPQTAAAVPRPAARSAQSPL